MERLNSNKGYKRGWGAWLLILFAWVWAEPAAAQFEGEVFYLAQEYREGGPAERNYHFLVSGERVLLQSSHSHRLFRGVHAQRFLFRNDRQDLVVMNHDNESLALSGEEAEALASMIRQMRRTAPRHVDWEREVVETGREEVIVGKQAYEYLLPGTETTSEMRVWLSPEIRVRWGFMESFWRHTLSGVLESGVPMEVFVNRNSFPLRIEYWDNGELTTRIEAVRLREGGLSEGVLSVPEGMVSIGVSDLMMRMVRGS